MTPKLAGPRMDQKEPKMKQKTVVLFPGAWSRGVVELWLKFVIEFFTDRDYRVIIMRYKGTTVREMVDACKQQLGDEGITEGVIGIAYSMGGVPLRRLARHNPKLFSSVILLAATTQYGLPFWGYVRGVLTIPWEFFRGFFAGNVTLDNLDRIRRAFFNWEQRGEAHSSRKARELIEIVRPEPMRCCLRLVPLPFFHGNTGPLKCPVVAVVPHNDLFYYDAKYCDQDVTVHRVYGDHGFILDQAAIKNHLTQCLKTLGEFEA